LSNRSIIILVSPHFFQSVAAYNALMFTNGSEEQKHETLFCAGAKNTFQMKDRIV